MCLCATCNKIKKDYEIAIPIKPDAWPKEFRTAMICILNVDGFPFKEECKDYDQLEKPE